MGGVSRCATRPRLKAYLKVSALTGSKTLTPTLSRKQERENHMFRRYSPPTSGENRKTEVRVHFRVKRRQRHLLTAPMSLSANKNGVRVDFRTKVHSEPRFRTYRSRY